MHKNGNFTEDCLISKKCYPRTSLPTCKDVRYLCELNKSAMVFTQNLMVLAVETIKKCLHKISLPKIYAFVYRNEKSKDLEI